MPSPHEPHELRFVITSVLARTDFTEMRLDPRAPCDVAASIEVQNETVESRLLDLSAGGAFVALERPYPEGEPVRLHFELSGQRCALGARVIWRSGENAPGWQDRGMGIRFVRLENGMRQVLDRSVAKLMQRLRL